MGTIHDTPIVAFDESGNSGGNLMDRDQPVFVLASVSLPDDQAWSVLGESNREFKFSTLKRSADGRRLISDILDSPLLTEDRVLISAFHKRFMAVSKIVDLLIEPLAYQVGIDLYERGQNLALSNLLFMCLPTFVGGQTFELLLDRFVLMIREPSQRTVQKFYRLIETAHRQHSSEIIEPDLQTILSTRPVAEAYIDRWSATDLDPAIPAFFEHGGVWTERLSTPFRILHDSSKPIENEQVVLEAMMSTTESSTKIGYDRRKMTFPIAAHEIELADSSAYAELQLADVIAGACCHFLRAKAQGNIDALSKALLKTRVFSGSLKPVWPEPKVTPEELGTTEIGGVDALNYVGDYVSKRLGGIPPKGQRRKL